jgi:hypothetical protein
MAANDETFKFKFRRGIDNVTGNRTVTETVDITHITDSELLTLAHLVTVMLNERELI